MGPLTGSNSSNVCCCKESPSEKDPVFLSSTRCLYFTGDKASCEFIVDSDWLEELDLEETRKVILQTLGFPEDTPFIHILNDPSERFDYDSLQYYKNSFGQLMKEEPLSLILWSYHGSRDTVWGTAPLDRLFFEIFEEHLNRLMAIVSYNKDKQPLYSPPPGVNSLFCIRNSDNENVVGEAAVLLSTKGICFGGRAASLLPISLHLEKGNPLQLYQFKTGGEKLFSVSALFYELRLAAKNENVAPEKLSEKSVKAVINSYLNTLTKRPASNSLLISRINLFIQNRLWVNISPLKDNE